MNVSRRRCAVLWLVLLSVCQLALRGWALAADIVEAPTIEELKRATYSGFESHRRPVKFKGGEWQGKPYVEGGSARPALRLIPDFHLVADLDDDRSQEAIVLVSEQYGGSGERLHLVVFAREQAKPRQRANVLLGDRVQVREAKVDHNRIVLELVRSGTDDPLCCPGELATVAWTYGPDGLTEVAATQDPQRLRVSVLEGSEWRLRAWDQNEPAAETPAITLALHGERLSGSSGCNSYFALVRNGARPGEINIAGSGTTRKACAPAVAALEARFLAQLTGVKQFGFLATQLVLTYSRNGKLGTMVFARAAPAAPDEEE